MLQNHKRLCHFKNHISTAAYKKARFTQQRHAMYDFDRDILKIYRLPDDIATLVEKILYMPHKNLSDYIMLHLR